MVRKLKVVPYPLTFQRHYHARLHNAYAFYERLVLTYQLWMEDPTPPQLLQSRLLEAGIQWWYHNRREDQSRRFYANILGLCGGYFAKKGCAPLYAPLGCVHIRHGDTRLHLPGFGDARRISPRTGMLGHWVFGIQSSSFNELQVLLLKSAIRFPEDPTLIQAFMQRTELL